jgi:hypothetical protein
LAGCSKPAESTWQPPADYAYTLDSRCGEQLLIGRIRLWVEDGVVVRAEGLDEPGVRLEDAGLEHLPTLATLVGYYNDAVRTGADTATIETDPADGHPVRIDIDHGRTSLDDESCFVITDYDPS